MLERMQQIGRVDKMSSWYLLMATTEDRNKRIREKATETLAVIRGGGPIDD
jgi:hypothetical protein